MQKLFMTGNKYKNKKYVVDGIEFSSQFESKCYTYLSTLKNNGIIKDLKTQPVFLLMDGFKSPYYDGKNKKINKTKHRETTYVSDFEFIYLKNGKEYNVVLETKGFIDQKYPIKKKWFLRLYGEDHIFLELHRVKEFEQITSIIDELIDLKYNQ